MASWAAELPKIEARLNGLVDDIVSSVHEHDPLELLRSAFGHFAAANIGVRSESELDFDTSSLALVIEYIQSVIAGTESSSAERHPVTEPAFQELCTKIQELYRLSTVELQTARSAARQTVGAPADGVPRI